MLAERIEDVVRGVVSLRELWGSGVGRERRFARSAKARISESRYGHPAK